MNDNDKGIYEHSCEVSSLCTVTLYTALIRVHCVFASNNSWSKCYFKILRGCLANYKTG